MTTPTPLTIGQRVRVFAASAKFPADAVGEVVSTMLEGAAVYWPHRGATSVWRYDELEAVPAPKRGRPTLPDDQRGVSGSLRLIPGRWAKLRALLKHEPQWLDKRIDLAKPPGGAT
jgi:hypothetical protein